MFVLVKWRKPNQIISAHSVHEKLRLIMIKKFVILQPFIYLILITEIISQMCSKNRSSDSHSYMGTVWWLLLGAGGLEYTAECWYQ